MEAKQTEVYKNIQVHVYKGNERIEYENQIESKQVAT